MKTLDEVEPRIPIHASDLPLTITEPNSYYLAEDVSFTDDANHAITIECNDVTIDLMGFSLTGPDSGTKSGIYMDGRTNVEVRNGTVRDFGYGIHETSFPGKQHRLINVRAMSNQTYGIRLYGCSHLVKDCTAAWNAHYGIYVYYGSTVTGSIAYDNGLVGICAYDGSTLLANTAYDNSSYGISASSGCTVTGNTAHQNNGYGIHAGQSCTLTGNTSYSNQDTGICASSGCTITANTAASNIGDGQTTAGHGIYASGGATITGNTVIYNYGNGILLHNACRVIDNMCNYNGNGSDAAGIHATGPSNRIEGNNVTANDRGIDVDSDGNIIIKNTARGNTTNYDIDPNNTVGDILDFTVSGGTITSSNPWANFEY
jgi:parallel beta-helix repeat protein